MSPSTALATVPRRRIDDLAALYDAAVSYGANDTRASSELESTHDAIEMLAFALNRIPDIAICAHAIETCGIYRRDRLLMPATDGIHRRVAGALRLLHRATTSHARAVGYDTAPWRAQALEHAAEVLDVAAEYDGADRSAPSAVGQARAATVALTRAIVSATRDRLALPGHMAEAMGSLLALYALADTLAA